MFFVLLLKAKIPETEVNLLDQVCSKTFLQRFELILSNCEEGSEVRLFELKFFTKIIESDLAHQTCAKFLYFAHQRYVVLAHQANQHSLIS